MKFHARVAMLAIIVTASAAAGFAARSTAVTDADTKGGQDQFADYQYRSFSQAIDDGYFVEFPAWRAGYWEENTGGEPEWREQGWYSAVRRYDKPEFLSDRNPFKGYAFTTIEQAIVDGYYVPFKVWVPDRVLDSGLIVPGHWSWAIRRYDEPAYNYPPADHLYEPWEGE